MWGDSERLLRILGTPNEETPSFSFLADAPGYSCTLKALQCICRADTVIIYAKNETENLYYVWDFDTRSDKVPIQELEADHLRHTAFGNDSIKEKIMSRLYFVTSDHVDCQVIDKFSNNTEHQWCFGSAVNTSSSSTEYYVILGYSHISFSREWRNASYFYWLQYESLLRISLPRIYEKHIISSSAWNALEQTFKTVHAHTRRGSIRQTLLQYALGALDPRWLIQTAVRMSRAPITNVWGLNKEVQNVGQTLRDAIESLLISSRAEAESHPHVLKLHALIKTIEHKFLWPPRKQQPYFAFPKEVMRFILYETICNALAHASTYIRISATVEVNNESTPDKKTVIRVTVVNDLEDESDIESGTGREACRAAADAVGGQFNSSPQEGGQWQACLVLYGYCVPTELRGEIYD